MTRSQENNQQASFEVLPIDRLNKVRFYTSVDPGSYVAPHWHDALEIIYMEEGALTVEEMDGITQMKAGDCILIDANLVHSTRCVAPNRAVVFQIPLALLDDYIKDIGNYRFAFNSSRTSDPKKLTKIRQLTDKIERMQYLDEARPDGGALLFNGLLYEVLFQLYHDFATRVSRTSSTRHLKDMERLGPLLKYVGSHYREHISIEEAADITGFEPRYFCRFFKNKMGVTFLEYQNDTRLVYIVRDLLDTDDQVQDILERHGFTNYKLFRRLFREHFNMTPTQLREQHAYSLSGQGVPFAIGQGSYEGEAKEGSEVNYRLKSS